MAYTLLSNSPVSGSISWAGVHIVYDGVDYAIVDGSTTSKFVYWLLSSPTTFQVSDEMPSLGQDDTIVFLNKSGVAINVLNASALEGDLVVPGTVTSAAIATDAIVAKHIRTNAIIGRHIVAGQITAEHITVDSLQAISANMGSITSGDLTIDQAGFIRGGQVAYRDGRGFWLGYHEGTYKLSYKGANGVEFLFDGDGIGLYMADGTPILTATGVPYTSVTDTPSSLSQINSSESQKLDSVDEGATRNVARGEWVLDEIYLLGDTVTYNGSSWTCSEYHYSEATNKPPESSNQTSLYWTLTAAKGDSGEQALSGLLTNETVTLSATADGTVSDFSAATGTFVVYYGTEDVTASSTFEVLEATGCTGAIGINGDYAVTAMSQDTATLKLQAIYSGTAVQKVFSLAKSRGGETGTAASAYWIIKDTDVIKADGQGVFTPTSVLIKATSKTGEDATLDYAGRFSILTSFDGFSYSTAYTSAADESQVNYTLPVGLVELKIRLYSSGAVTALLDEASIPVVSDGITYDVKIESTNGDQFRVGQSTTTLLVARVFKNGVDVTNDIPESKFQWKRVSYFPQPYPNDDDTWNTTYQAGYKQVQINVDSVYARATFHCYIVE